MSRSDFGDLKSKLNVSEFAQMNTAISDAIGAADTVEEAPEDLQIYGRRDASWDRIGVDFYNKQEIDDLLAALIIPASLGAIDPR